MSHVRIPAALLAAAALLPAADRLPLGQVESVDGTTVAIRFDGAARLNPGTMVAIYGTGRVEKHPLTKDVIIEDRKLVAKVQLLRVDAPASGRVMWKAEDGTVDKGMDAVPLPGEAVPNAAPAAGAPATLKGTAGGSLPVSVALTDADGDPLLFSWDISGTAGASGHLDARTTGGPDNVLVLPGLPGQVIVTATARDPLGQTAVASIAIEVGAAADAGGRTLRAAGRWGTASLPVIDRLRRDANGTWWAVGGSAVHRIAPTWTASAKLGEAIPAAGPQIPQWTTEAKAQPGGDSLPARPVATVLRGTDLYVLDSSKRAVLMYRNGSLARTVGQLSAPTDLAITADGTILVADQGLGGVAVYEAGGKFRAVVGRSGTGEDAFADLTRIAIAGNGDVLCLDAKQRLIQRFDRFLRRIDNWVVAGAAEDAAVDLAWGPRGAQVLLASGKVLVYGPKGSVATTLKPLAETGLSAKPGAATAMAVDTSGETYVAFANSDIARYDANGTCTGVRSDSAYAHEKWCSDGRGRTFALGTDGFVHAYDHEGWLTARFGGPAGNGGPIGEGVAIAAVPDGSAVCVLDAKKMAVHRFATADLAEAQKGTPVSFGKPGEYNGQFKDPRSLACDEAGRTYVLDVDLYRVSAFDAKGTFLFAFGTYGKGPAELRDPTLVAVAPAGDTAYVFDANKYEMKKFTLDQPGAKGTHATNAGGKGDAAGQFREPVAMACDRSGLLYVADSSRGDVQVIDFRGSAANPITTRKSTEAGLKGLAGAAITPDGQFRAVYDGGVVELR
jgi:DNA-binding beta-propeller fold protein YncE